jgi:hypothetical protein
VWVLNLVSDTGGRTQIEDVENEALRALSEPEKSK